MVEQVTHCVRPAFLFCCRNAKMNACVDNGFAYLFYLTGVRKSLSVSASHLVFADIVHRFSSW